MIPWTAAIIAAYAVVRLADMITPRCENGTTKVKVLAVLAILFILGALGLIFEASLEVGAKLG